MRRPMLRMTRSQILADPRIGLAQLNTSKRPVNPLHLWALNLSFDMASGARGKVRSLAGAIPRRCFSHRRDGGHGGKFGEFIMNLELHRQGLKVAAIARQLGIDRKTVRKYISRGLEPPTYGPRPQRQKSSDPFLSYLRQRLAAFPGLTAVRRWRETRERGYGGGYTAVKRAVRDIRPEPGSVQILSHI